MKNYTRSFLLNICLLVFVSSISLAMERPNKEWKPMGKMDAEARKVHLANSFVENQDKLKGIHTYFMSSEQGRAFSFDGNIEILFSKELIKRNKEELIIFIPAAGVGRTVLDALSLSDNVSAIVNDLELNMEPQIKELIKEYGYENRKVEFLMGDVFEEINKLPDFSIDIVYCANLIHFLSPDKVDLFLNIVRNKLKPQGKLFICWRGFSDKYSVLAGTPDAKMDEFTKKRNQKNPRYVEKDPFGSNINDFPYYYATNNDFLEHVKSNYKVIAQGTEVPISVSVLSRGLICLGDYRTEIRNSDSIFINYFVLTPNNEVDKEINNHSCKICRKNANRRCSKCKNVWYCNVECQKKDWASHKHNCNK